jgi:hypothetical protein
MFAAQLEATVPATTGTGVKPLYKINPDRAARSDQLLIDDKADPALVDEMIIPLRLIHSKAETRATAGAFQQGNPNGSLNLPTVQIGL